METKKIENYQKDTGLELEMIEHLKGKKPSELEDFDKRKYEEWTTSICNIVPDCPFRTRVLSRLEIIKQFGKAKWSKNEFVGTLKGKDYYKVKILLAENKVYYSSMTTNTFLRGTLRKIKDTYIVTYLDSISESTMENGSIHTKTTTKTSTEYFDKENTPSVHSSSFEQSSYKMEKENLKEVGKKPLLSDYGVVLRKKNILNQEEYYVGKKEDCFEMTKRMPLEKVEKEEFEYQLKQGK